MKSKPTNRYVFKQWVIAVLRENGHVVSDTVTYQSLCYLISRAGLRVKRGSPHWCSPPLVKDRQ